MYHHSCSHHHQVPPSVFSLLLLLFALALVTLSRTPAPMSQKILQAWLTPNMARRITAARRLDGMLALASRRLDGMLAMAVSRLDWTAEWLNCHEASYIVAKGFSLFLLFFWFQF